MTSAEKTSVKGIKLFDKGKKDATGDSNPMKNDALVSKKLTLSINGKPENNDETAEDPYKPKA